MPYKPEEREYRSFDFELRNESDQDYTVRGYASTYLPYTLYKTASYEWREKIDEHAFDEADLSDVVFLLDHTGRVYARTKNDTVHLTVDARGLFTETDLSRTSSSREVYEDIKAGNYQQMSFAFRVGDDAYEEHTEGDIRVITRTIKKIEKCYDISAVAFPANPTTDISVATRAAFDGAIEKLEAERQERERKAQEIRNEQARALLALKFRNSER